MEKFVAYLRVSTQRQGRSGLGLDAQTDMIEEYLRSVNGKLCATFKEIESGKYEERPELTKALSACRVYGATLIVAKLDRLARNSYFVEKLLHDGARFRAVDCPEANEVMIKMLSIFADYERRLIGERTRAALAAAKRRHVELGGDRGNIRRIQRKGSRAGNAVRSAKAVQRAVDLESTISEIKAGGAGSLRQIAEELNRRDIQTARGGRWSAVQVQRVTERVKAAPDQTLMASLMKSLQG